MSHGHKSASRSEKFSSSLHKAESRQLEHFLKDRSAELDKEISALKSRLGSSAMNMGISGRGLTALDIHPSGNQTAPQQPTNYAQEETSNYRANQSHDPRNHGLQSDGMSSTIISAPISKPATSLNSFLLRIKLKMEDAMYTPATLRDMLLPSDLNPHPNDVTISISELSIFLQTDLIMPVSRDDQLMILKTYGNPSGDVNIKNMLSDAGIWYDGPINDNKKPIEVDMAMTRLHAGVDFDSTVVRGDGNDTTSTALKKKQEHAIKNMTDEDIQQQATLDRMTRGNNATECTRAAVGNSNSTEYNDTMHEVSAAVSDVRDARNDITKEDEEKYNKMMSNVTSSLLPETNIAKIHHSELLERSSENIDILQQMHLHMKGETTQLNASDNEKRRLNAERAAIEASKNIKLPTTTDTEYESSSTGPSVVMNRDTGAGFINYTGAGANEVKEQSDVVPSLSFEPPAPQPLKMEIPVEAQAAVDSVSVNKSAAPGAGGNSPVFASSSTATSGTGTGNLNAPPPLQARNPNLTMKEAALLEENARLKGELSSFDSEFWEQLEDLKYRYNHMQELVGSDQSQGNKFLRGYGNEKATVRPEGNYSRSSAMEKYRRSGEGGNLPLDSVGWAKRNPSTAMDNAALDTPLMRGKHPRATDVGGSINLNSNNNTEQSTQSQPPTRSSYQGTPSVFDYSQGGQQRVPAGSSSLQNALHERGYPEKYASDVASRNAPPRNGNSGRSVPSSSVSIGGDNSQRVPLLRHATGGYPSGPLYGEKESNGGSLASMCERKLLFELGNHPNPEHASQTLIHRIVDTAARFGHKGKYLTPAQLVESMTSVGLRMSASEVTMFAAGFGSDGRGGVDVEEICEALQALLYNFVGENDRLGDKRSNRVNDLQTEENLEKELIDLLNTVASNSLAHDKKAVLGAGRNIYDTLIDPFLRSDVVKSGVLSHSNWCDVMSDIGCMLLPDELKVLGSYFQVGITTANSNKNPETDDEIKSFREKKIKSMLSGAAKADERFASWLANSDTGLGLEDKDEPLIAYQPFCVKLSSCIEDLIDNGGGLVAGPGMGGAGGPGSSKEVDTVLNGLWMLREFELIENLICQLELMKPNDRRRCLMSLQYALAAADTKNDGTIDGFSLLSSLLGAGFRLQRLNRVRLLKAVEELGGKMDYSELCQVLLRSCAEWTSEERNLVNKILKSMGITVLERRAWLGRLRVSLMSACVDYNKKQTSLKANTLSAYTGESNTNQIANDPSIPPSNFLHVLRDCGVVLSVDEEATLLDCLDTERLAEMSALEKKKKEKTVSTNPTFGVWGVPMVYYKSFLAFCSRHTGDWSDAAPETTTAVMNMIQSTSDPMKGLHEFASLLKAFDEQNSGSVGNRAFQIVCHRARLFANLSENDIRSLSDILTAEGGGKIRYTSFLIHMRVMITKSLQGQLTDVPDIAEQLLINCMDSKNTLLPLRNWLLRHTNVESCKLTMKELNSLLREFSVLYRPDDLQSLLMEIGSSGPQEGDGNSDGNGNDDNLTSKDLDTRDLFRHLFKVRGTWMSKQPYLCNRMVKAMTMTGASLFTSEPGNAPNSQNNNNGGTNAFSYPKGPRGIETAAARRLLARLRAFTEITSFGSGSSLSGVGSGSEGRMVDLDIFGAISKACGIPMSDEELLILADSTDFHPLANRIRCDVVLEAISYENSGASTVASNSNEYDENGNKIKHVSKKSLMNTELSDAATFAIKHLKEQLWKTCKRLKRNSEQWINDVNAVFRGFDNGGVGFITTDDFTMGLALLNAPCSAEILRDIPSVPEGPGMVSYIEILEVLLVPPASMISSETTSKAKAANSMGNAHFADNSQNEEPNKSKPDWKGPTDINKKSSTGIIKKTLTQAEKDMRERELSVNMLITVIRKSLKSFIINDHSLEEAWMCVVRAFKRFDSTECGKVSPRDFCLAVSILLEGDEVLLTETQWTDIIQYFTDIPKKKGGGGGSNGDNEHTLGAPIATQQMVDYMLFAQKVLDTAECKKIQINQRMADAKNNKGKQVGAHK
jgi:Ca2+-binding EF-hand superfamily protein